jgi:hypothetical protein
VPGFDIKRFAYGYAAISVRHVLLFCPRWIDKREEKLGELTRDLREVLGTEHGATAAIRLTLRTGLLEQFKTTAQRRRKECRRGTGEE